MSWQVEITRGARKELEKSPAHMQARIAQTILPLEDNPFPHDCKKLRNRDGWRIRVGDYRLLYFADAKAKQIVIGVIGHRREVYRI